MSRPSRPATLTAALTLWLGLGSTTITIGATTEGGDSNAIDASAQPPTLTWTRVEEVVGFEDGVDLRGIASLPTGEMALVGIDSEIVGDVSWGRSR